ncbi:MAG: efflux RND transporter periplasmic adaptor subunit [Planctomycetaceae bacterium]
MQQSESCRSFIRSTVWAMLTIAAVSMLRPVAAQTETITVPQVTISLVRNSEVAAMDSGTLTSLVALEGQTVVKGDIVAVLHNDQQKLNVNAADLKLQVAALQADDELGIQTATAQLQEAKSGRQVKEVALEMAESEARSDVAIQVATADAKLQQLELERAENARSSFKGSISATQLDRLKTAVQKSELEIQLAQDEYRIRQLKPKAEQAGIQQKDDEIQRFEAAVQQEHKQLQVAKVNHQIYSNELALAKLQLEHRNIRAPFDGVIAKVERHVGEWVDPGITVVRIIDLKTLRAEGFLPARQASADLVGRAVRIEVPDAEGAGSIAGTVTFVSSEIDPVNQQVRFWAEFDNSQHNIRPGLIASMVIDTAK